MLYLIGIGLGDEKDISIKALDIIRSCDVVYLEGYTSMLQCKKKGLEELYRKEVLEVQRDFVEENQVLEKAKEKDVALLIIGDALSATTHISLLLEAKKSRIKTKVIHNASILTAVGETGLELYKFGRVASIPFDNKDIKAPLKALEKNQNADLHTLFLLDLDPKKKRFMGAEQAAQYLIDNKVSRDMKAVACAALGSDNAVILCSSLEGIARKDIGIYPQCLIIPSKKLHFIEEEALSLWS